MVLTIVERDDTGLLHRTSLDGGKRVSHLDKDAKFQGRRGFHLVKTLTNVFLPSGYPSSVSADYLRYQIFNSLQAFCSSLAGLIASRATLEGFGVGKASASATNALLLTVLQDVFGRLATIVGAYYIGTSLYPEAKTYRLLADILFEGSTLLNTLSPLLATVHIPFSIPLLGSGPFPGLRIAALCVSAAMGALCGVAAGGSKSALTLHFASPVGGKGDVGELSAKDASKETVLSLLGMLIGSFIVPRLNTQWSTYTVSLLLIFGHFAANYAGVRGVALRSLNRQRAGIAWIMYRSKASYRSKSLFRSRAFGPRSDALTPSLTPEYIASRERIFERSGALRNACTNKIMGYCTIGTSFSSLYPPSHQALHTDMQRLLGIFDEERYILCFDPGYIHSPNGTPMLHICLKAGHTPLDQLKAWVHALEVGREYVSTTTDDPVSLIASTNQDLEYHFASFIEHMRGLGWDVEEGALMTGTTGAVLVSVDDEDGAGDVDLEEKKDI